MPEPLLTKARQSVWRAIEDWTPLHGVFRRTWKFEEGGNLQRNPIPTIGDLPALAIYPSKTASIEWVVQQSQRIPYVLEVELWTSQWTLLAGERLWEEIVRALFQSAPPGQPSHVFLGTGHNGVDLGPVTVSRETLGTSGPTCTRWRWRIGLRIHWNPAL